MASFPHPEPMPSKEPKVVERWAVDAGFEFYINSRGHHVYWHPRAVVAPGARRPEVEVSSSPKGSILGPVFRDFQKAFANSPLVLGKIEATFPGRDVRPAAKLCDRMQCHEVIDLLRSLTVTSRDGRKSPEPAFAVTTETRDGVEMIVVSNPFYRGGSPDPIRSRSRVYLQAPIGKRPLGPLAVEDLKDLGVDLELASVGDVEQAFGKHVRAQRRAMGVERMQQRSAQRQQVRAGAYAVAGRS